MYFPFILASILTGVLAAPLIQTTNFLTQVLLAVAPTSSSCANEPAAGQCRTADQAARPISQSFENYNITTNNEKAALISLMIYETGSFKYNENVFPGRPGQGTRNMQMINFNALYAESIPSLAPQLQSITGSSSGIQPSSLTTAQQNKVRGLLTGDDDLDFGSAAWFLTTQCSAEVRTALRIGGVAGWSKYITQCVGTTIADRQATFDATLRALSS